MGDQSEVEQQDEECHKVHHGVVCVQPALAGPTLAHGRVQQEQPAAQSTWGEEGGGDQSDISGTSGGACRGSQSASCEGEEEEKEEKDQTCCCGSCKYHSSTCWGSYVAVSGTPGRGS